MDFKGKIILAPLAGISDSVFRRLCREHGADGVVTEMVSAEGILHKTKATIRLMRFHESERPVGIQLFGADAQILSYAAAYAEEHFAPDFIDLNAGCPVHKVVQKNGGSALLRNRALFGRIIAAMVKAVHKTPITVKIRSGWNQNDLVDVEFAGIAQNAGAAAVTLHPRTQNQAFGGQALWERITEVRSAITIPLIGNGDIIRPGDAKAMMEETGCDSVMIGRAALGNPWIFSQCRAALNNDIVLRTTKHERYTTALRHIDLFVEAYGEERAILDMKKHCGWYIKGLSGAAGLRNDMFRAESTSRLKEILEAYFTLNKEERVFD